MNNHLYIFNGEPRQQRKGGPIGLGLTGDVAQVFMCWWDRELVRKMEEAGLGVVLYKRYVDDINLVMRNRDARPEESNVPYDEYNMKMIQQMADQIHQSIETTVDYPSRNADKK